MRWQNGLFGPKDVGAPVKVPLQHQSNAQLLAHKVAHEVLDPALWFPIEEVVRDKWFPET